MKAIDRLSDRQVLALAKFIVGCVRMRQSSHWRKHLASCAQRNTFMPFVETRENDVLRDLFAQHLEGYVWGRPTSEVLRVANEVAREWGEPPLEPKFPHVAVQLSGEDGNIFAIIGRVQRALRKGGASHEDIDAFWREVRDSHSYEQALVTIQRWVEVS